MVCLTIAAVPRIARHISALVTQNSLERPSTTDLRKIGSFSIKGSDPLMLGGDEVDAAAGGVDALDADLDLVAQTDRAAALGSA